MNLRFYITIPPFLKAILKFEADLTSLRHDVSTTYYVYNTL